MARKLKRSAEKIGAENRSNFRTSRKRPKTPRKPLPFKRADLRRAIKSAADAGVALDRIEVDPASGKISMIVKSSDPQASDPNPWLADLKETKR